MKRRDGPRFFHELDSAVMRRLCFIRADEKVLRLCLLLYMC